jgi:hypothetical protein
MVVVVGLTMNFPEAVRKHDGRSVAFDVVRLAGSIARAACASDAAMMPDAAKRLGNEIAQAVGAFIVADGKNVAWTADIRQYVGNLLRETNHVAVADAYADHSRAASSLLWRIRVVEPGTPFTSTVGTPWDRRRLLDALRACGVARDPAGDVAREVERRVVALGQERISPALIHALTAMVLSAHALDIRRYVSRRLAFSMSAHVPHFDAVAAELEPLPQSGPALSALWLQAVHTQEVVTCAADNLISLEPYPTSPSNDGASPLIAEAADPLVVDNAWRMATWSTQFDEALWLKGDSPERLGRIAYDLSQLRGDVPAGGESAVNIYLQPLAAPNKPGRAGQAAPITINLAGLLVREALRDHLRTTVRIVQLVNVAAQAHRQREAYFNLSPVRGRTLPVAVAGLWNAAAWMQGESFDAPQLSRASRSQAASFVSVLRGAVDTLRNETGMELILSGVAPLEATKQLWRQDREFFLRDGVTLDANASYDGGPSLKLAQNHHDASDRLDFLKSIACAFDFPPALTIEVPLGTEGDAKIWRELLGNFAQAGIQRLRLVPGGSHRGLRNLLRMVRSHLQGYPLFEQVEERGQGSGDRGL